MKKVIKIALMLAIIMIIWIQIPNNFVYGYDIEDYVSRGQTTELLDTNDYNPANAEDDEEFDSQMEEIAGTVLALIRNVGIIVAVVALMVIGLKTMVGSVEEKSAYKQALPGYLLGVFMVVAVTVIPSIIYNLMQSLNS